MKSSFRAYYTPSESELADLWDKGLVILDANALLNFFRYTPTTRDAFFGVLDSREESLWIPHQVGLEFHRNRHDVIADQRQAFGKTITALRGIQKDAEGALDKLEIKRHSALDVRGMKAALKRVTDNLSDETEKLKGLYDEAGSLRQHKNTLDHITTLYDGRVGGPYNEETLAKIYVDGKKRYALKRPPGYKDSTKGEPGMYGDLVLWKQILDAGEAEKRPAIFVTDDVKEDWWLEVAGEKKGPRPELVHEYFEASGERIHFYTPERFIEFARKWGVEVSQEAQAEVEEVSDAGRRAADATGMDGTWWGENPTFRELLTFSTRSQKTGRALTMRALGARQRLADLSNQLVAVEERLGELDAALFDYEEGRASTLPIESVGEERARLVRDHVGLRSDLQVARDVLDEADEQLQRHESQKEEFERLTKPHLESWVIPND